VIDVFTHSSEYYPSPVLYPITDRGFDGIAWPTSWFMALNYAALGIAGLWLWRSARKDNPVNTQGTRPRGADAVADAANVRASN
jgi:hypothetical protein